MMPLPKVYYQVEIIPVIGGKRLTEIMDDV
jgi:hypothetical protein